MSNLQQSTTPSTDFVQWFRDSAPYINAHRGGTFVVFFGGEAVDDSGFPGLIQDLALLNSLGVRLVLVHGARAQIERKLRDQNSPLRYVQHGANHRRVTAVETLPAIREAIGTVRFEVEARLSTGLANTPMAGARLRVASGNYVTARPLGVIDGVDLGHTGTVRRVDADAIRRQLDDGAVVLLSPLGYSPTGELFNISAAEVAGAVAAALGADKLLCLVDGPGLQDACGALIPEMTPAQAADQLDALPPDTPHPLRQALAVAVEACRQGVRRTHLISRQVNGALLLELYTRDGVGTLITRENFEDTRQATIDDVGGILDLITPLERDGVLVRRSRERLEMEIEHFLVVERDGHIIACAALYPFPEEEMGELACLAVDPAYRDSRRGDQLLTTVEREARRLRLKRLCALTTQTAHWFLERGFQPADVDALPVARRELYNYRRNSKIFLKNL